MGDEVTLTETLEMTVRAEPLVQLIRNYTNALRFLVQEILAEPSKYVRWRYVKRTKRIKWEQDLKTIHHEFYDLLKEKFELPPKFAIACEKETIAIVKSVLNNENNKDRKCVIRGYRARCDYQAYRIEIKDGKCYLKLRNFGEIEVTGFSKKWFERFKDWDYGDLILKIDKDRIKLPITVKKTVKVANASENAIAVDLNFNEVVVGNKDVEIRFRTPLQKIMHIKKNHIEKTQRRYNKQWLHVKGIRRAISKWWKRISNITDDFVKQVSRRVVVFAKELGYYTIVLEDLNGLRDKQAKQKMPWRERFTFFVYRKLQSWIDWQAMKEGLAIVYVNPKDTSSICPECGSRLKHTENRTVKCEKCDVKFDRDSVAVRNLVNRWLNILRCGA